MQGLLLYTWFYMGHCMLFIWSIRSRFGWRPQWDDDDHNIIQEIKNSSLFRKKPNRIKAYVPIGCCGSIILQILHINLHVEEVSTHEEDFHQFQILFKLIGSKFNYAHIHTIGLIFLSLKIHSCNLLYRHQRSWQNPIPTNWTNSTKVGNNLHSLVA